MEPDQIANLLGRHQACLEGIVDQNKQLISRLDRIENRLIELEKSAASKVAVVGVLGGVLTLVVQFILTRLVH